MIWNIFTLKHYSIKWKLQHIYENDDDLPFNVLKEL